ncbi:MAG TPA: D-2-hydroxyacid dehydrogenase [Opitutaceae bacterium]|jgi:phosphoglycerate dehydrogenase-like enzyme|nr:D-2-hydroxyacid dehydrogenase [Opitutaceae bacterium]
MKIWCNGDFGEEGMALLREGTKAHTLVLSGNLNSSVLAVGGRDPAFAGVDIAFGQPDPEDCMANPGMKWIEVSSAGFTRYDTLAFKDAIRAKGAAFTNASQVYAEPCAEHVLAMMLTLGRELLPSFATQNGDRAWNYSERRSRSVLLQGQTVVLLGFGAIGRRVAELLAPFGMRVYAIRRQLRSEPGVHVVSEESMTKVLSEADHVVNVLPENDETRNYVNSRRISCFRKGARFYNVGRGMTVDQDALIEALKSGRIGAAYLDVTVPEPLPASHPLWSAPNCYITPHTAGGRNKGEVELVRHFLANLASYENGTQMIDRIL